MTANECIIIHYYEENRDEKLTTRNEVKKTNKVGLKMG